MLSCPIRLFPQPLYPLRSHRGPEGRPLNVSPARKGWVGIPSQSGSAIGAAPLLSSTNRPASLSRGLRWWEIFLVDFCDYGVIRVNHLIQMNLRDLGEKFVGVHLGEAIVVMDPLNQLGKGDAQ